MNDSKTDEHDHYRKPQSIDGAGFRQVQSAPNIVMTPELFEKIYLSPQIGVKGDLRATFANPTPLAILGFLLASSPLSCVFMGWRGSGGNGAAFVGSLIFMGGVLQIIGGLLNFFIGNTFPFVVFSAFGGFWLAFGVESIPFFNAAGAYSSSGTNMLEGQASPEFQASFAFWTLFMAVLCFIFMICALRTNVVLVFLLFTLMLAFTFFTGSYWNLALGKTVVAHRLAVGAGGITFVTSLVAWYLFFSQLLEALDFPFQLPVGDLSHLIKGASEKESMKREKEDV
ncbi:MAG: hypothetical protein M1827_004893 [Pycnora praestabilis]|nr:MAG: hypothetical protein M1827_004893 [Pycnora praestabilis]